MSEPKYEPITRAWGLTREQKQLRVTPGFRIAVHEASEEVRSRNGWSEKQFGDSAFIETFMKHKHPGIRVRTEQVNREWKKTARRNNKIGSTAQG